MQSRELGLPNLTPWLALKVHPYQHNPRVMQCLPLVVISLTALPDLTLCAVQLPGLGVFRLNPFRLIWRSCMVVIITVSHSHFL